MKQPMDLNRELSQGAGLDCGLGTGLTCLLQERFRKGMTMFQNGEMTFLVGLECLPQLGHLTWCTRDLTKGHVCPRRLCSQSTLIV